MRSYSYSQVLGIRTCLYLLEGYHVTFLGRAISYVHLPQHLAFSQFLKQMDGWIDIWMNRQMDGYTDGQIHGRVDTRMDG